MAVADPAIARPAAITGWRAQLETALPWLVLAAAGVGLPSVVRSQCWWIAYASLREIRLPQSA